MKKMFALLLAFTVLFSSLGSIASASVTFKDIDSSPMKFYIEELAKNNVISGYADGTFRPKEELTRANLPKCLPWLWNFLWMPKQQHHSRIWLTGQDLM